MFFIQINLGHAQLLCNKCVGSERALISIVCCLFATLWCSSVQLEPCPSIVGERLSRGGLCSYCGIRTTACCVRMRHGGMHGARYFLRMRTVAANFISTRRLRRRRPRCRQRRCRWPAAPAGRRTSIAAALPWQVSWRLRAAVLPASLARRRPPHSEARAERLPTRWA